MSSPWRPKRWQMEHQPTPCRYGFRCINFRKDKCTEYHPRKHHEMLAHNTDHYNKLIAESKKRVALAVDGLGEPVAVLAGPKGADVLDTTDVSFDLSMPIGIKAHRMIGSFNRFAGNKIAVPGFPRRFVPPTTEAMTVQLDDGPDGQDARPYAPTYTHGLEPLLRAVQCMTPEMDILGGKCDIVANVGSLYRLFSYFVGNLGHTTRLDLEWRPADSSSSSSSSSSSGGGTLLMQKWSGDPNRLISYGYGRNFADATCRFDDNLPSTLLSSTSHHRVLYYELGGLRFAVHCEIDAYYDPQDTEAEVPQAAKTVAPKKAKLPMSPPISPKLTMASPSSPSRNKGSRFSVLMEDVDDVDDDDDDEKKDSEVKAPVSSTLDIEFPCGPSAPVPANKTIELKTFDALKRRKRSSIGGRPSHYTIFRPDAQMYFGRVQQLYEAGHENGTFSPNVHVENVESRLKHWEAEAETQEGLQRLVAFLRGLIQRAAAHAAEGHTRLSLVLPSSNDPVVTDKRAKLYVRNDGVSFLPETL